MFNDYLVPEVYKTRNLHDDWIIRGLPKILQPWTLIPRKWTFVGLPMPSFKIAGNADPAWIPIQQGYPLAPMAKIEDRDYFDGKEVKRIPHVLSMHPVHPTGQWSVQGVYVPKLQKIIPCYWSQSNMMFGRRLHTNGPLKPDVTLGDWAWWLEGSFTWTKLT